ncbi:MAG: ABC transporter permease [Candidatus Omnitrophica bacterium]|nr:ABC transporter permease [Candidatus Omnitrophota bacterium]
MTEPVSRISYLVNRISRNTKYVIRNTAIGGFILVGLALIAVFAPWISPYDPLAVNLPDALLPPSAQYWLGTDLLGRDVLSRLVYGARISLVIGLIAVGVAVLIGTMVGLIAGYLGGRVDSVVMRFVDTMLAFPSIFLLLAVIAMLSPSIYNIMVVIGLTSWMGVARLVRAEVLTVKEREFVLAARTIGASTARIMLRHVLPNVVTPVLVAATLGVGGAILTESVLSYLGLGVQPPTPSWGNILNEGRVALGVAWWLTLTPGVCILVTVLAFNLLGEGLRERWRC